MSNLFIGNQPASLAQKKKWFNSRLRWVGLAIIIFLSGCSFQFNTNSTTQNPAPIEKAQVVFIAALSQELNQGETIELVILDEITGLLFNQTRIEMEYYEGSKYIAVYEAPIGSLIPFRFEKVSLDGSHSPEVGVDGNQIRLRMYRVDGPAISSETIAGWTDFLPNPQIYGTISGKVISKDIGEPIKDIIVTAGGVQTITDANGNFNLSPLFPGSHTLIAYSMNGSYVPAHIEAGIADHQTTQATLEMRPSSWREVTFTVNVPEDTFPGAKIRMAGNLAQLGNTFVELGGGMSGDINQMPVLSKNDDRNYILSITLPTEIDIRYKYTMGDGFWNAEHGLNKSFVVHQLIIPPDSDQIFIQDQVASWKSSDTETIWFQVNVPEETPEDEQIAIQFSVAEWMPSLSMFKISDNQWAFPLISPHNFSGEIPYRFCRNTPCTGKDQFGVENLIVPRSSETRFSEPLVLNAEVSKWAFLSQSEDILASPPSVTDRETDFIAGIALTPFYSPTSHPYILTFLDNLPKSYNHIVLEPAWVTSNPSSPTLFEISMEGTLQWNQMVSVIEAAHQKNLMLSLFPLVNFPGNPLNWWEILQTEQEVTWELWFTQYRDFVYQYATLAELTEIDILVIGGDWVFPALPVGENASRYHQPGNIESLWEQIISGIRERYHGEIAWNLSLEVAKQPPAFFSTVDKFYLQWDLSPIPDSSQDELATFLGETMDTAVKDLETEFNKPIILMLAIPSVQGFGSDCIPSPNDEGNCIDVSPLLLGPSGENPGIADIHGQAEYYAAFLTAVSDRTWIDGVISQGYYPSFQLHDPSASIHGKPAEMILRNWFSSVLGN